jgi:hypothetical protein
LPSKDVIVSLGTESAGLRGQPRLESPISRCRVTDSAGLLKAEIAFQILDVMIHMMIFKAINLAGAQILDGG